MNNPDDNTFEKLLAAIHDQPDDQTARGILADRLHELGEYELEDLWRGGAEKWLHALAARIVYEFNDPPHTAGESITYDDLMKEIADWIKAGTRSPIFKRIQPWDEPYRFSDYQLTNGCDVLEEPGVAEMMWRCVEIVWGKRLPQAAKECGGRMLGCGSCGV
jgi:uncharacterized protein (TIGR02996 family)